MYGIVTGKSQSSWPLPELPNKGANGRTICRSKEICTDARPIDREVSGLVSSERPFLHGKPVALSPGPLGQLVLSFSRQPGAGARPATALSASALTVYLSSPRCSL